MVNAVSVFQACGQFADSIVGAESAYESAGYSVGPAPIIFHEMDAGVCVGHVVAVLLRSDRVQF